MKKTLLMIILIIAALVFGGLIAEFFVDSGGMTWLSYYKDFSFSFDIVSISLNCSIKVYVAQLIMIIAAIFAYTKLAPKIDK